MSDLIVVEGPAHWDRLKQLVLDSVSSPITKRVYNMALNEFLVWFRQAPRPGFTKATVSAWRVSLEERKLGSSSIIVRMSAIRKLAAEAADNCLLAPELAAGIARGEEREDRGRSLPEGVQILLANCLAHGRRQFVEVAASFPEACRYVLETLGDVYKYDAEARERKLSLPNRPQWMIRLYPLLRRKCS